MIQGWAQRERSNDNDGLQWAIHTTQILCNRSRQISWPMAARLLSHGFRFSGLRLRLGLGLRWVYDTSWHYVIPYHKLIADRETGRDGTLKERKNTQCTQYTHTWVAKYSVDTSVFTPAILIGISLTLTLKNCSRTIKTASNLGLHRNTTGASYKSCLFATYTYNLRFPTHKEYSVPIQ